MIKEAYVQYTPGHKNSKGEPAPWTIRDHETGEILQSYKTKEEAEKALKRMKYFKHKGDKTLRENIGRIARLLREAAGELENEAFKRKVILSRKTGEFDSDLEDLDIQNEKTEAFLKEFKGIWDQHLWDAKDHYNRRSERIEISIPLEIDYEMPDDIDSQTEYAIYDEIDIILTELTEELMENIERVLGKKVEVIDTAPSGTSFTIAIEASEIGDIYSVIKEMESMEINGELTAINIMDALWATAGFYVDHEEDWYEELIESLTTFCQRAEEDYKKVFKLIHDFKASLSDREYWQKIVDSVIKNIKSK
jgi:hypothetical protein